MGGTDERVYELAKNLSNFNIKVYLFVNIHENKFKRKPYLKLIKNVTTRFGVLSDIFFIIVQLMALIKQGGLDIIQIELYNIRFSFVIVMISKLFASKCSIIIHDKRLGATKPLDTYFIIPTLKKVNSIIFVDKQLHDYVIRRYGEWIRSKSIIIHNAAILPTKKHNKYNVRDKHGLTEEDFVITFIGSSLFGPNLDAIKFIFSFCDKYKKEIEEKKIKLILVDSSSRVSSVNNYILCPGYVDDIFDILQISDIGLAPMSPSFTGSHIKVYNYMAAGLPVLSTKDGVKGIKGIKNNKNVLLFNDLDDMMKKINILYEDRHLLNMIGKSSKELIIQNYTWKKSALKLSDHYKVLINEIT